VDLENYGPVKIHNLNPILVTIDDFCTDETLSELRQCVAELEYSSAVLGDAVRNRVDASHRSAEQGKRNDDVFRLFGQVQERVTKLLQFPPEASEPVALLRYTEGQEYKNHYDATAHQDSPNSGRIFTAVLYLNDDFSGGQTTFPRLTTTIQPKAGRLVIWGNKRPNDSVPHPLSLHAGEPVESGVKYIASFWIHRPDEYADRQSKLM